MRVLIIAAAMALLTGCASQQAKDNFSYSILGMEGMSRDEVLRRMGAPDSTAETSSGNVLTYTRDQNDKVRGYYDYTFECQVDFWIADDRVSDVRYAGSGNHPYYNDIDYCARVFANR